MDKADCSNSTYSLSDKKRAQACRARRCYKKSTYNKIYVAIKKGMTTTTARNPWGGGTGLNTHRSLARDAFPRIRNYISSACYTRARRHIDSRGANTRLSFRGATKREFLSSWVSACELAKYNNDNNSAEGRSRPRTVVVFCLANAPLSISPQPPRLKGESPYIRAVAAASRLLNSPRAISAKAVRAFIKILYMYVCIQMPFVFATCAIVNLFFLPTFFLYTRLRNARWL